jgi:hypothetical protein
MHWMCTQLVDVSNPVADRQTGRQSVNEIPSLEKIKKGHPALDWIPCVLLPLPRRLAAREIRGSPAQTGKAAVELRTRLCAITRMQHMPSSFLEKHVLF